MERSQAVKGIRPDIHIEFVGIKNEEEQFMHETLRPILKFQHPLIVKLLSLEKTLPLERLMGKQINKAEKRALISNFLQKNTKVKTLLLGMVIGLFQESELEVYLHQRKAIDKRIIEMIITRFLSEFSAE